MPSLFSLLIYIFFDLLSVYLYLYSSRHSYSYSWLKAGVLGGVWVEKQQYNSLETHMSDQRWEEDRQRV